MREMSLKFLIGEIFEIKQLSVSFWFRCLVVKPLKQLQY